MKPREKCGIIVAPYNIHDAYKLLKESQNRGRESAGIAAKREDGIDIIKWAGEVEDFKLEQLVRHIKGKLYIGHVRYSTFGSKESVATNAHPHHIGGVVTDDGVIVRVRGADIAVVHNGNFPYDPSKYTDVEKLLKDLGSRLYSDTDTEILAHYYARFGEEKLMRDIPGSYVLALLDSRNNYVIVMKDRFGFKPAWLGEKDGSIICASEDFPIRAIGGEPIREIREGEIVYIGLEETKYKYWTRKVVESDPHFCFFEYNYFSRWETVLNGRRVLEVRRRLGEQLASEIKPDDADFVTYAPAAPKPMARAYSEMTGIPFREIFFKRRQKRSFQGPSQDDRIKLLEETLFIDDRFDIRDKTLVVIDDSIVRMNVLERIIYLSEKRGAKKVYFLSATPMIGISTKNGDHGCKFGVDMPPGDEDFAAKKFGNSV
ncbi:MAG: hypothetical protein DRN05_07490, partial [Thermoplasmata archaeon]